MKRLLAATSLATAFVGCAWNGAPARLAPAWRVEGVDSRSFGCSTLHAEIAKSGKAGFGLVVVLLGEDTHCPVAIDAIEVRLSNGVVVNAKSPFPGAPTLEPGAALTGYVALRFDNNQAWNDGARTAVLTVRGRANGLRQLASFALEHEPTWKKDR